MMDKEIVHLASWLAQAGTNKQSLCTLCPLDLKSFLAGSVLYTASEQQYVKDLICGSP